MITLPLLIASVLGTNIYNINNAHKEGATANKFNYYGGPVVSNVKVIPIFWGDFTASEKATIENYYTQVTNSSYLSWLSEYNTPTQKIGKGSFVSSYHDVSKPSGSSVSDTTFKNKVLDLIAKGLVPANDADTYYPFHLGGWGSGIRILGSTACVQFGALHFYANKTPTEYVYWGLMPDCGSKFDWIATSHELVETITDPLPDPGTTIVKDKNAWVDSGSSEVGDVCSGSANVQGADGKSYKVQTIYSNVKRGCTAGY